MIAWENCKKIGTAILFGGKIVWGAEVKENKENIFICNEYPNGTKEYNLFKRMDWCSPKNVIINRNKGTYNEKI